MYQNEMKRDIIKYNPSLNEFRINIETNIIEILRPYINKTILILMKNWENWNFIWLIKINRYWKSRGNEKLTGIFILGGDALRRYNNDASITKDIDAKIYIPINIPFGNDENIDSESHNEENVFRCVTSNLIKLLTFLENNKEKYLNN